MNSRPRPEGPRFGYVDSPWGQLHYAEHGDGPAVLLLHQTPRSWDEYRELLPLLAGSHQAVAVDMLGFGASPPCGSDQSIERMADAAVHVVGELGIDRFAVVGHHTGALVAMDVAARFAGRVSSLVLSAPPWPDLAYRGSDAARPAVDGAARTDDGSYLRQLWDQRAPFYPTGRPDLLERFVHDGLTFGLDRKAGHRAITGYVVEDVIDRITAPVLILSPLEDPFALPRIEPVRAGLSFGAAASVRVVELPGGAIPVMEQMPVEVARLLLRFLAEDAFRSADRPS